MSNYSILKTAIQNVIRSNNNNEITGPVLQQTLLSIISSLGYGFQFAGVASPAVNPGEPDERVFYIASTPGRYTQFGNLIVNDNEVAVLKYNGSWTKDVTGAATIAQINELSQRIDDLALGEFYGFFVSPNDLPTVTNPGYAYVGANSPFSVYYFKNGIWVDSGTVYGPPVGNGEDIDTNSDGELQFANRPSVGGKGYIILRKDKSFSQQVSQSNTIYEIRYDFNLGGLTVNIPANSVLYFVGGSIDGGTIVFNNTEIRGLANIFGNNLSISGTIVGVAFSRWYVEREDWTRAFNELFNLGAPVELEAGKEYRTGAVSNYNIEISDKNFQLNGNGATLYIKKYPNVDYSGALFISTAKTESFAVESVQQLSNPERTQITVDGSNYEIGDVLKLYSDDIVSFPQEGTQYCGEFISPMMISFNGSKQIITIQGGLYYEYSKNIRIAKLNQTRTVIRDLTVISETTRQAVNLTRLYSPILQNIHFRKSDVWPTISVCGCVNALLDGIVVNRVDDSVGWIGNGVGYGVNVESNQNLKLVNSSFYSLRHAYTTGGNNRDVLSENDWLYYGPERGDVVSNCSAYNCQLAFDTHPVGVDITFDNCTCDGGTLFEIRTPRTIARNSLATNASLAFITGCADEVVIENCLENSRNVGYFSISTLVENCRILVRNCRLQYEMLCRYCPGLELRLENVFTKSNTLAQLSSDTQNCKVFVQDCELESNISSGVFIGCWQGIYVKGLRLKTQAMATPNIIRNLKYDTEIELMDVVMTCQSYDNLLCPVSLINSDSLQYVVSYFYENIILKTTRNNVISTDKVGYLRYDNKSIFTQFTDRRISAGKIILPRYPSQDMDFSDLVFGTPAVDGVEIQFINSNNFVHQLPTLNGVTKTIQQFATVTVIYSNAGGWRWQ